MLPKKTNHEKVKLRPFANIYYKEIDMLTQVKRSLITLIFIALFSIPIPLNSQGSYLPVAGDVNYLFVLGADKGTIVKEDNTYYLVLQGVHSKVVYFSDRPQRRAGFITTDRFLKGWKEHRHSLIADPPNAAFVHADIEFYAHGKEQVEVLELLGPPEEMPNGIWRFEVRAIGSFKIAPVTFDQPLLFIDDMPLISD